MSEVQVKVDHIPLVDLGACNERLKPELDAAWRRVMDNSSFIYGQEVAAFEEELSEYVGVKHTIGCGNGTDAIVGAIKALDLPDNAEIIAPDFTFIAPMEAILHAGYRGVFVDVDPGSFTMDPNKVEEAIGPDTKAIIAVHLNGQCANMEAIAEIANRRGLYLIEDAAQGIGSQFTYADGTRKMAGSMAHISTTSFFPSKNLGGIGDGGAVFTNDEVFMKKIRTYFAHGKSGPNYQAIGINSRLDGIQAAALRIKLAHLDDLTARRQAAAGRYDAGLAGLEDVQVPVKMPYSTHTYHKYSILVKQGKRAGLQAYLKDNNIASKVYYAFPCHDEPPYQHVRYVPGSLDVSSAISQEILSIPMHTEMTPEIQGRVVSAIVEYMGH
jgi:UDP-2-acetamido-2-deoxy-ribo-hexuluronate aminotransferase